MNTDRIEGKSKELEGKGQQKSADLEDRWDDRHERDERSEPSRSR